MSKKRRVLILCTGNSCRSQMAEALIDARLGDKWEALSAGTEPAGYTHPKAIAALAEIGIEWNGESQHVDLFRHLPLDLVITVCDDAEETCPVWIGEGIRHHISFPDPAKATGTEEEIMAVFRAVRDDISTRVVNDLVAQFGKHK